MEKKRFEVIVGSFVLLGIIILVFFVFFIGGFYFFKPGYNLDVGFSYVSGLAKGASVRYAGVPVGEVVDLKTVYEEDTQAPSILLTLWVKKGVEIRENSSIEIRGAFALSEAHIEITSRGIRDGKLLQDGDYIRGVDPTPLDHLISEGEEITRMLKEMLKTVSEFVTDEEINYSIRNIILNLSKLTANLNDLLGSTEGDFKSLVESANKTSDELHVAIKDFHELIGKFSEDDGTIGKLLNDKTLYNELILLSREIRANPWKLLRKTKEKKVTLEGIEEVEEEKKKGFFLLNLFR